MPADLVWTREAPTCAGWYWVRNGQTKALTIAWEYRGGYWQNWPSPGGEDLLVTSTPVEFREWSGPIPLPKEAM